MLEQKWLEMMEQRREAKILEQKWLEAKIAGAKMA